MNSTSNPLSRPAADGDDDLDLRSRSVSESSIDTSNIIAIANAEEEARRKKLLKIETVAQKIYKDKSPEAVRSRRIRALRAGFGEFMCTFLFLTPILGSIANSSLNGGTGTTVIAAFVSGFQAIGVSFAFSSISGAHFNPAISFALWLTNKLSNRKAVLYISVQFLASIVSMAVVASMFHTDDTQALFDALSVRPVDKNRVGKIFSTEFFLTFMFTYVAFTVVFEDAEQSKKDSMSFKSISDAKGLTVYASTPQSKTGFAPFAIGFTIFSLNLITGTSGGAFNPARMLGPAIFSGQWDLMYLYFFAQFFGSSCAALFVQQCTRLGISEPKSNEPSVISAVDSVQLPQKMRGIDSSGGKVTEL